MNNNVLKHRDGVDFIAYSPVDQSCWSKNYLIEVLRKNLTCGTTKALMIFNEALKTGLIKAVENSNGNFLLVDNDFEKYYAIAQELSKGSKRKEKEETVSIEKHREVCDKLHTEITDLTQKLTSLGKKSSDYQSMIEILQKTNDSLSAQLKAEIESDKAKMINTLTNRLNHLTDVIMEYRKREQVHETVDKDTYKKMLDIYNKVESKQYVFLSLEEFNKVIAYRIAVAEILVEAKVVQNCSAITKLIRVRNSNGNKN